MTATADNAVLIRKLWESFAVAVVCTGISLAAALGFGWVDIAKINLLEIAAVFTSYSCTYLCVVQSRWNYPIGIISTILLCITFLQAGLLGSAALNAYLPFALLYGWLRWGKDTVTRPVTQMGLFNKWWIPYLGISGTIFLLMWLISSSLGMNLPLLDSSLLAGSILAQLLLDNKRIETWIVWAIVNVLSIYVYFTAGLYFVAFQFIFFLANTAWGWWQWKQSMADQPDINHGKWFQPKNT